MVGYSGHGLVRMKMMTNCSGSEKVNKMGQDRGTGFIVALSPYAEVGRLYGISRGYHLVPPLILGKREIIMETEPESCDIYEALQLSSRAEVVINLGGRTEKIA
jgi:hypothetical protein